MRRRDVILAASSAALAAVTTSPFERIAAQGTPAASPATAPAGG